MKVMLRQNSEGTLLVYVAKKDLEEEVVKQTDSPEGKIYTLEEPLKLPQTVEAKRLA